MTRHVGDASPNANDNGPNADLLFTLKMDWTIGVQGCGGISDLTSTGSSSYATNEQDYSFGKVYEIGLQNFPVPPIFGDVRKFDVIAWPNNDRYLTNNGDQYDGIRVLNPQDKPFRITGNPNGSYTAELFYRAYKMVGNPYPIYVLFDPLYNDPLTSPPRLVNPIVTIQPHEDGGVVLKFSDAHDPLAYWRIPGAVHIDGDRHLPNRNFRYTLNGTNPTNASAIYDPNNPPVLNLGQAYEVRVQSSCSGWHSSDVVQVSVDPDTLDMAVYDSLSISVGIEDAFEYDYSICMNADTPEDGYDELYIELTYPGNDFDDPVFYYSLDGGVNWTEYTEGFEFPSAWKNPPNLVGHPNIMFYAKERNGPKRSYVDALPVRIYHPNNQIVLEPDYPATMTVNGRNFTITDTRNFASATLSLTNVAHHNTTVDDKRYFEMVPSTLVDPDGALVLMVNKVRLTQSGVVRHFSSNTQQQIEQTFPALAWGQGSVVGVMFNYKDSSVWFRIDDGAFEGPFNYDRGTNIWMEYVADGDDLTGTAIHFNMKQADFDYPTPFQCLPLDSTGATESQIVPGAPSNLQVVDAGDTLELTWDPGQNATSYVIYMSTNGNDNSSNIIRTNIAGTSYSLPKPTSPDINNLHRYFRVAGVNGNNLGDLSNSVQGDILFDGVTLLHYWSLSESSGTRVDSIGGGDMYPLNAGNAALLTDTGPNANQGNAVKFTHGGDFLMGLPGTVSVADKSYTIVGWVYRQAMANAEYTWDVFGDGNLEDDNDYTSRALFWTQGLNTPPDQYRDGSIIFQDMNYTGTYSTNMEPGWSMISASVNKDTGELLFMMNDGVLQDYGGFTVPTPGTEGTYSFGGRNYFGYTRAETGTRMNSFMVFKGVLSEQDRLWLYNDGNGRTLTAVRNYFEEATLPDTPQNFAVQSDDNQSDPHLSWDEVTGASGYVVYQVDRDLPTQPPVVYQITGGSTLTLDIARADLDVNKAYQYRVAAIKAGRYSKPSAVKYLYTGEVISILRFINGSVGSQTFTDELGLTWTPSGSVSLSNDVAALYPGGKVLKSTNGGFIQATSSLWQLPAGSRWTMEMYVSITGGFPGGYSRMFGQHGTAQDSQGGVGFEAYNNRSSAAPWIRRGYGDIAAAPPYNAIPSPMQHMAAVCDGEYINFYFEGVYRGRFASTGELVSQIVKLGAANGSWVNNGPAIYIGAFRFTRGLDLYRENFTPELF